MATNDMKKQSITVDMPLQNEDGDNNSSRLKLAAQAAKNAKEKRRNGRILSQDIIKETDETR